MKVQWPNKDLLANIQMSCMLSGADALKEIHMLLYQARQDWNMCFAACGLSEAACHIELVAESWFG